MNRTVKIFLAAVFFSLLLAAPFQARAIGFEAEKVYESVFVIYAGRSVGSGFALGENCIVTNAHVIKNAEDIQVVTYGGEQYGAEVFLSDDKIDIALLLISELPLQPLPVADAGTYGIGDDIYTIGAPNSMAFTLTKGVISAKEREIGSQVYIQIDAAVNAGNSGGPLLDDSGRVIGVNTLKVSDNEGLGLSVPMTTVLGLLTENGVELDDKGNIVGELVAPVPAATEQPTPDDAETAGKAQNAPSEKTNKTLAVFLVLSVLLNIALIIALVCRRKKDPEPKPDPSERTDFEIDILE